MTDDDDQSADQCSKISTCPEVLQEERGERNLCRPIAICLQCSSV